MSFPKLPWQQPGLLGFVVGGQALHPPALPFTALGLRDRARLTPEMIRPVVPSQGRTTTADDRRGPKMASCQWEPDQNSEPEASAKRQKF
eukprot:8426998-Karenia_brevis.AAC.1